MNSNLDNQIRKIPNRIRSHLMYLFTIIIEQSEAFPSIKAIKGWLLLVFLGFCCIESYGQDLVRGKVINDQGEPIPGVNIIEKGTTNGTISDIDGNYSLIMDPNGILVFSYVGYFQEEQYIEFRSTIDVRLTPEVKTLKEMVVVGYGVQSRTDLTGAVSTVERNEFNPGIINSPDELFQGKIPGIDISKVSGEPGSESFIRIRGANTIRAANHPLIVIDGYPMDITNLDPLGYFDNLTSSNNLAYSPFTFLNPQDIESVDVLKDASAAAIYGSRGSNGVVMITTKKGSAGKGRLSYNGYVGVSQLNTKIRVLTADEFRAGQEEYEFSGNIYSDSISTDWQDEIYQDALTQNHDLSFSGGSDQTRYRASISYSDQDGIVKTSNLRRITGRANIDHLNINNRLSVNFQLVYGQTKHRQTGGYPSAMALYTNPTWPVYDSTGYYYNPEGNLFVQNPVAELELNSNIVTTDKILSNIILGFEIVQGLNARVNLGGERAIAKREYNQDHWVDFRRKATLGETEASSIAFEGYLDYQKGWNNHYFNMLAGYSYQKFNKSEFAIQKSNFTSNEVPFTNVMGSGKKDEGFLSSAETSKLQSVFARLNYNFKGKYLLTINYRLDGSSRFGVNNQYGHFPSFALGWNIGEESLLKNGDFFDVLKLRGSWGITGNQEIPNKISQYTLSPGGFPYPYRAILDASGTYTQGYSYGRAPNPDLKWEETTQWDVGLDFAILNNRISGTLDYFDKRTTDLLLLLPVSNAPTTDAWGNIPGTVINKGIETLLSIFIIRKREISWNAEISFTKLFNTVEDLPGFIPVGYATTGLAQGGPPQRISNGEEIGTFYGRVFEGLDDDGQNIFKTDENGDYVMEVIGQALPRFLWGLTNTVRFKGLDLTIFINGAHNNDVYNNTFNGWLVKRNFLVGNNITPELLASNEAFDNTNEYSSRYIEDGTFMRLHNVTLGYSFNVSKITWLELLRIYITGTNLYTHTKYSGYDPEVNILNYDFNGIPPIGLDYRSYPKPRSILFGINLTF